MKILGKPLMLGVPTVMVTALVAVLALWAWGPIGGASHGGPTSNATAMWNVEYWHRNADGELLENKRLHNAVQALGLDAAMERLINKDAVLNTATANVIGEEDAFDQIVLMSADDPAAGGLALANILTNVDGGTGDNAGQAAGGVINNPADGVYANPGSTTGDGLGTVTLQFLADGDPAAATQMHLVKAAADNTVGGAAAIAEADVLATIEISVDLADTDTLTVTWTLDVN